MRLYRALLAAALAMAALPAVGQESDQQAPAKPAEESRPFEAIERDAPDCVHKALATAPADIPVSAIRDWCRTTGQHTDRELSASQALRARLALEDRSQFNPFVLTPHKRNYVLPFSYWSNRSWRSPDRDDNALQPNELKFQVSLKTPVWDDFLGSNTIYAAFTMTSFWQAYNKEESRPFRETNYAPAVFVSRPVDWHLGPVDSELLSLGFVHESNGRSVPESRGWNRIYADYIFRTGSWYVSLRPWYRIPEGAKDNPTDPRGDDNPDIERYLGHFELTVSRPFNNHVLDLTVRNNLHTTDNNGSARIDYSFPLNERFKGFFQVFTGYGDSLIQYDDYVTRVSVGILLTDML